jgi:hypothetical protein
VKDASSIELFAVAMRLTGYPGDDDGVRLRKQGITMKLSAAHIALLEQLAEKQRVTYGGVPEGCDDSRARRLRDDHGGESRGDFDRDY